MKGGLLQRWRVLLAGFNPWRWKNFPELLSLMNSKPEIAHHQHEERDPDGILPSRGLAFSSKSHRQQNKKNSERNYPNVVRLIKNADPRQLDLPGATIKIAGSRRPGGEYVKWSEEKLHGDGCAGQGVAEETDGRQDARGGGNGSRHERAQRAAMAHGSVSVTGASAPQLAHAARSLWPGVRERGGTAVSGR